jgi:polysaccharide export outer membrane protein
MSRVSEGTNVVRGEKRPAVKCFCDVRRTVRMVLKNDLFRSFIALMIFLVLLLTSCAGGGQRSDALLLQNASSEKSDRLNAELGQKAYEFSRSSVADYKVGPEDLLEIDVFGVPELKTTARVSATGYIKLSLIDKIEVSGLTVSELESAIAEMLQKYLQEPVVSVFVKDYRSQQISVLGSVKDPRTYYATGQKYLLDMLSLAGGLGQDAGSICIIQRPPKTEAPDDKGEKIVVDLDELILKGRPELNIPILSGDMIVIPRAGIFFVDGAVRGPGEFSLKGKTTFTQAVAKARGLSFEALHSDIRIYRDTGKSEREVITVDYDAILDGKAPDIDIKDKDIIIVSRSGIKSFIGGLAGTLNFGIFSMRGGL